MAVIQALVAAAPCTQCCPKGQHQQQAPGLPVPPGSHAMSSDLSAVPPGCYTTLSITADRPPGLQNNPVSQLQRTPPLVTPVMTKALTTTRGLPYQPEDYKTSGRGRFAWGAGPANSFCCCVVCCLRVNLPGTAALECTLACFTGQLKGRRPGSFWDGSLDALWCTQLHQQQRSA
jgi:hypothetical protein